MFGSSQQTAGDRVRGQGSGVRLGGNVEEVAGSMFRLLHCSDAALQLPEFLREGGGGGEEGRERGGKGEGERERGRRWRGRGGGTNGALHLRKSLQRC